MLIRKTKTLATLFLIMLTLSACGTTKKRIDYNSVNNIESHLATNFALGSLDKEKREKLESANNGRTRKTNKISINQKITTTRNNKSTSSIVRRSEYKDIGSGVVRELHQFYRNDIPYAKFFQLSYAGVFAIKSQSLTIARRIVSQPTEILSIDNIDFNPGKYKKGSTHKIDYTAKVRFRSNKTTKNSVQCQNTNIIKASKIDKALSGKAIALECKVYVDNNVNVIKNYWYLGDYGISISNGSKSAKAIVEHKILSLNVSN